MTKRVIHSLCVTAAVLFAAGCRDATRVSEDSGDPGAYTVASGSGFTYDILFDGRVQMDRSDVKEFKAPCKRIMVKSLAPQGQDLERGDPMIVWDTSKVMREIPMHENRFKEAGYRLKFRRLLLEGEVSTLLAEKQSMERELELKQAVLASRERIDADKVALLHSEYLLALQTMESAEAAWKKSKQLFDLGQISEFSLLESRHVRDKTAVALRIPKVTWEIAAGKIDRFTVEKLRLTVRELKMRLGLDQQAGAEKIERGINGRIRAKEASVKRQIEGLEAERTNAEIELRVEVRDSADHTPVNWIEILDTTGATVLKVNFQPQSISVPAEHKADYGQVFSQQRGYGWDRDVSAVMKSRDNDDVLTSTLALIRRRAIWRCALKDGTYTVRVGIGDSFSWDGIIIRSGSEIISLEPRLEPGKYTVSEGTVEAVDGTCTIEFGHDQGKVMRAPMDGSIRIQRWMELGKMINFTHWPLCYLSDPSKQKIHGRVHQDLAKFLKVDAAPAAESADKAGGSTGGEPTSPPATVDEAVLDPVDVVQAQLATHTIRVVSGTGKKLTGTVKSIGKMPLKLTDALDTRETEKSTVSGVKDAIAREIVIALAPEDAKQLKLNESVRCKATVTIGPDTIVIPDYLVNHDGLTIQPEDADEPVEFKGFSLGSRFVVVSGLEVGTRLVMHSDKQSSDKDEHPSVAGEVIPGEMNVVALRRSGWGRIRDIIPDGSMVEKGDVVVTLYNPRYTVYKEKVALESKKANQAFMQAADARRLKSVEAGLEHREKAIEEELARNKIHGLEAMDPLVLETSEHGHAKARMDWDYKRSRYELLETSGIGRRRDLVAAEFMAGQARVIEQTAMVSFITATRQTDWLALRAAYTAWDDALDTMNLRETSMAIARREEMAARIKSERDRNNALAHIRWRYMRGFKETTDMTATVPGKIFFLTGWDDSTRRNAKFGKESIVWNGLPVAQILDMSKLGFTVDLSETYYQRVAPGMTFPIVFDQYNQQTVEGTVTAVGRRFFVPPAARADIRAGRLLGSARVFRLTLRFATPKNLMDKLVPGVKGRLLLEMDE